MGNGFRFPEEESSYEDRQIGCVDCHRDFTFTAGEQRYFAERQLQDPKRCPPCRAAKKLKFG